MSTAEKIQYGIYALYALGFLYFLCSTIVHSGDRK